MLQPVREAHVIRVEDRDVLPGRVVDGQLEGLDPTHFSRAEDLQARIGSGQQLQDLRSVIGRSVIDDNQLQVLEGLSEYASDGLFNILSVIMRTDDHADFRHVFSPIPRLLGFRDGQR